MVDDCSQSSAASGRFPHANHRNPSPIGASRSRDRGIAKANFAVVLCLDAHMSFFDDDWSLQLIDHVLAHPNDVCCFRCPRLDADQTDIHKATAVEYGAFIAERKETRISMVDNGVVQERPFRSMLLTRWSPSPYQAKAEQTSIAMEVGCILGGAYAFQREWYEDGLGAPWRHQRGWGSDEQHLALPNFMLGGRNMLLPVSIAHVFRNEAPYMTNVSDIVFNSALLCQLVLPEAERAAAVDWILEPWTGHAVRLETEQLLNASDWQTRRQVLSRAPRTFEDYRRAWMMGESLGCAEQPAEFTVAPAA